MKKIIGTIILVIIFLSIFLCVAYSSTMLIATCIFLLSIALTWLIGFAIHLITENN